MLMQAQAESTAGAHSDTQSAAAPVRATPAMNQVDAPSRCDGEEPPSDSLKGPATLDKTANPQLSSKTPESKSTREPGPAPQDNFQTPTGIETRAAQAERK